jgi:2-oxoglutarate ferredoxin oxidoreductase subunit alpha
MDRCDFLDLNVAISGRAGDGIKEAGAILAKLFATLGYRVFVYQEYQSLIRGGYNISAVRISSKKIHSHRFYFDFAVCLEDYTYEIIRERIRGPVVHDDRFKCDASQSLGILVSRFIKEESARNTLKNAVTTGAMAFLFGLSFDIVSELMKRLFGEKSAIDIRLARKGYDYAKRYEPFMNIEKTGEKKPVLSGNEMIALGMSKAGLKTYFAYPMTPTSPILHFLASKPIGVKTFQPESEIAAIMMAIGSAFAGMRSAVGTSGGGLALMSESISLSAMSETPVLIVEGQRSAPSTGMATFTAQEDLEFALNPAHGEFPLIVASPCSVEDSYYLSGELLNLAWEFQTPAILLTDKHLVESYETVEVDFERVNESQINYYQQSDSYCSVVKRYELTDSGISKIAFPPELVKGNSNEHDEYGFTTDSPEIATSMYSKRMRKEKKIREKVKNLDPYFIFGEGKETVITWGSTFGAVIEPALELGFRVIVFRYLRPLVVPEIDGRVISVECNYSGLLAKRIENEVGIKIERITRVDGRPFTPEEIRKRLER